MKLRETSLGNEHKDLERNMSHTRKTIRKHCQSTRRVVKMLVAVVVAFFVCWAPFHAQRLVAIYGTTENHHARSPILLSAYYLLTYSSGIFYYLSTCINPIFYHIMSNKFRDAFKLQELKVYNNHIVITKTQRSQASTTEAEDTITDLVNPTSAKTADTVRGMKRATGVPSTGQRALKQPKMTSTTVVLVAAETKQAPKMTSTTVVLVAAETKQAPKMTSTTVVLVAAETKQAPKMTSTTVVLVAAETKQAPKMTSTTVVLVAAEAKPAPKMTSTTVVLVAVETKQAPKMTSTTVVLVAAEAKPAPKMTSPTVLLAAVETKQAPKKMTCLK
ncbi:Diapause hormone receptor-1 [Operophtera brumata]|uniref:Diapause hormone receptor-1 n=1 Tax=Operophtera brumata TaxID=104452 RepID=A0A0L7KM13_OPEBR|nr:Diapause hormone receptor-1 [Operophtera brumata]